MSTRTRLPGFAGFKFHWVDNGHIAIQSETRSDVSHIMEFQKNKWICTCENATIEKNPRCKHVKWMDTIDQTLRQLKEIREQSAIA
jgi:hypothetical protein